MKLVTGGDGFIGSNLNADIKIKRTDCDLTDYSSVIKLFKKYSPETVIHAAAKHGSAIEMVKDHSRYIENNILCDINIIKACKETGVKNLLMLSTITSFDQHHSQPFTEEAIYGEVNEKIFGYAYSKKVCVGLCKAYQLDYDLNYKSIFLGNTYGPHGKFNKNGTVIHNLIYRFFEAIKNNEDVHLFGDGNTTRNYLYVEDLNAILDRILFDNTIKDPIIVSNDIKISIINLVKIIQECLNFKNNVVFDNKVSIGDQLKIVDTSKLKKIIKNFKFTDIENGIPKTIEWFLKNN